MHPRARQRRDRERGAALVEFAIVFPLLVLLLSGIIDFGMAFSNLNAARQGVREGARQAVVANLDSDGTCTILGGGTMADATRKVICMTKSRIGLPEADTRVMVAFGGTNQVGDSLLVCAQYPLTSATGVFEPVMDGRALTSKVEMRIEKTDLALTAGAESALPGEDWSWCV